MSENNTFKSAVVGVDFSDGSKQALRIGAYLQNTLNVPVTAHHVVDTDGIDELADAVSLDRGELIEDLKKRGDERILEWAGEIGFTGIP